MDSVVHFEIPAKNLKRAEKFYKQAFAWKIDHTMDQYFLAYTSPVDKKYMPTKLGAINGALQSTEASKTTRVVVDVKNIDAAIRKVKKAGGKLVSKKVKVYDMLWYAVVADTEGNEVGLSQYLKKR